MVIDTQKKENLIRRYGAGDKPKDIISDMGISSASFYRILNEDKKKNMIVQNKVETKKQVSFSDSSDSETDYDTSESESDTTESESDTTESESDITEYDDTLNDNNTPNNSDSSDNEDEIIYEPPKEPLPSIPRQIPRQTRQPTQQPEPEPEIEHEPVKSLKETQTEKRVLIQKIKNYTEMFKEHITSLIGFTPKENLAYFNKIKSYSIEELEVELEECQFLVANRNSINIYKHGYFYAMGAFEKIGTSYLDLHLTGLTAELARNKEIDLILKEIGCNNVQLFQDPKIRLLMVSGFNILACDSNNRVKEYMEDLKNQQEGNNENQTEQPEEEEEDGTTNQFETNAHDYKEDREKDLLRELNNFNI